MKILDGRELSGYIKERQSTDIRRMKAQGKTPHLLILRDNDDPVINKYVNLKKSYGADIGAIVEDRLVPSSSLLSELERANSDENITGIILQLPLKNSEITAEIIEAISPEKDVDGLNGGLDSATALSIHQLLAGYNIDLTDKKLAIVGKGRLVGAPLAKMWGDSNYDVTVFDSKSNLNDLINFDVIVSATGSPRVIKPNMLKPDAVVVDAGTASEDGALVGDIDDAVRNLENITVTPRFGGVGPMTVTMLFENLLKATHQKP